MLTTKSFRALCTGTTSSLSYRNVPFHRIIDEFMVQGGDIKAGDGTGSVSIYGDQFDDENLDWRELDEAGLVCMANSGKNTNGSQFFISLVPCPHLNGVHTIFGRLVSGQETLQRMASVEVDDDDKPKVPVVISHCGELERRSKRPPATDRTMSKADHAEDSEDRRGRGKRRHSDEPAESTQEGEKSRRTHRHHDHRRHRDSRSRSPRPRDGSKDRHRHRHRHQHYRDREEYKAKDSKYDADRRRSDFSIDHTLRGRSRRRSETPDGKKADKHNGHNGTEAAPDDPSKERHSRRHHRSPSPSRAGRLPEDGPEEPTLRRRRSLPNQYEELEKKERRRGKDRGHDDRYSRGRLRDGEEDRLRAEEWEREGARDRYDDAGDESGRLGGGWDEPDDGAIKYKGRGAMRYREKRRW
jgi:peptidyl-prolyl isomerase G (cyclophilin G)